MAVAVTSHSRKPAFFKLGYMYLFLFEVMLQFFIGLDHPATAWPFLRSMISINTIRES